MNELMDASIHLFFMTKQNDCLLSSRAQVEAKNINILVQVHKNVTIEIYGDRYRLEHVMNNLLSNAIKFSPDNSDICLSLSYETKVTNSLTFAVRDYGPGISNDDKGELFKPFMQVRPGELQKGLGSGLGLSICKNMIELHRGSIDCLSIVRSKMDNDDMTKGGTEFFFTIRNEVNDNDTIITTSPTTHTTITTSTTSITTTTAGNVLPSSSSCSKITTAMVGIMPSEMIYRLEEFNDRVNAEKSTSLYSDVYRSSSSSSSSGIGMIKGEKSSNGSPDKMDGMMMIIIMMMMMIMYDDDG